MILINKDTKYTEFVYKLESDFETDIFSNSQLFFGNNTILIDVKKKIESKSLGNSIPDGFLLHFKNKREIDFYIIEVELSSHDFYRHIFPQVTKFFAFLRNPKNQADLIERVYNIIETDPILKDKFKKLNSGGEIYKSIKDAIENNGSILLIIDGIKPELPEIIETYTDTWGEYVKIQYIQKYLNPINKTMIFTVDPEFEYLDYTIKPEPDNETDDNKFSLYSETNHLENVSQNVNDIYTNLKTKLNAIRETFVFNPRKYYIAIKTTKNIAFIKLSKKRCRFILLKPYTDVVKQFKKYEVVELAESVQKFWNGPSCAVIAENLDELDQIIKIIVDIDKTLRE